MNRIPNPSQWQRWAMVVLAVGAMTGLRFSLDPLVTGQLPFLLYVLAILLSAWFGGFGPGLLATASSFLLALYFFLPPYHSFQIANLADIVRLIAFAMVGLGVSWVCALMREVAEQSLASANEASFRRDQAEKEVVARELATSALQESEADFRALFELAAVGMAQADPATGRFKRVNRTFCEMLGYSEQELLTMSFSDLTHPDDRVRDVRAFLSAVRGDLPLHRSDKRYIRKSGEVVWVSVHARIVHDSHGQPRDSFAVIVNITDRQIAQQHLQDRETQLRQIGDNLPDGFLYQVIADMEGTRRFVHFSAGLERITGVRAEAALQDATALYSLIHPADMPRLQAEEERCLREHCTYEVIARLRHAGTGRWFWAQMRSARRTLSDGRTIWDGLCLDVTRARETEEALQRSTERLQLAQRAGHIGVFDWNVQTNELVWTEEQQRLFGVEPGKFDGRNATWEQRVHPEDLPRIQENLLRAMAGKKTVLDHQYRIVRPDGEVRWIEGASRVIYDETGAPCRLVGVNLDVTERREAQGRLEQSEASLQAVVQSASASGIGILRSHQDGRILETNDAFLRIVGYTRQEWEEGVLNWLQMTPPEFVEIDRQEIRKVVETGQSRSFEKEYFRKDGSRVPVLLSGNFAPGKQDEFICFVQDLSELKQAEGELRAAKEAAESANQAKDHFLAVLSHELRTPLAPVMPLLEELLANPGAVPPELQDDLRLIRRNIALETQLIDDLLDLTRIVRGKLDLAREVVDVHALLREVEVICCTQEVREKNVRIECDWHAVRHFTTGDPIRLQQAFWNLINNACKFSRAGGIVVVKTSDLDAERICIEVSDDGAGISPELLPRLFQPFEQGERQTGTQRKGLGLGLAITKSLIEAHAGAIAVESAGVGLGATFRVVLPTIPAPVSGEASGAPASSDATPVPTAPASRRILLVEDHADTAQVMERILTRRGHVVEVAHSKAEALVLGGTKTFDVLVSDLGLPDGSGLDLPRELYNEAPDHPFAIALSGFGTEADLARSKAAGFAAHLVKPADLDRLVELIAAQPRA